MSMFGTLQRAKTTKFEDVRPGSIVEVHDRRTPDDSMVATVLESKKEYGPTSVPALLVKPHGEDMEPTMLLFSNGNWVVTVITDSAVLLQEEPPDVLVIVPKPQEKHALEYTGGVEVAEKIIRWASGKAVITWHAGEAGNAEHLTVHTLEGEMRADIHDFVVRGLKDEFYPVKPEVLDVSYDIIRPA